MAERRSVREIAESAFTREEISILRKLSTPIKIQDYLDSLPINFEKKGETCMSARRVLREKKAHCIEGAFVAAAALMLQGEKPLVMDLKTLPSDQEHVVTLYKRNGRWGAISKTNHATLRFRDPIYTSPRELAASYFHEYFLNTTGLKTLRSHSGPIDLMKFGTDWMTSEKELWKTANGLNTFTHFALFPSANGRYLRKADSMERKAGRLTEWDTKGSKKP
jgi:hypothetical protein